MGNKGDGGVDRMHECIGCGRDDGRKTSVTLLDDKMPPGEPFNQSTESPENPGGRISTRTIVRQVVVSRGVAHVSNSDQKTWMPPNRRS